MKKFDKTWRDLQKNKASTKQGLGSVAPSIQCIAPYAPAKLHSPAARIPCCKTLRRVFKAIKIYLTTRYHFSTAWAVAGVQK